MRSSAEGDDELPESFGHDEGSALKWGETQIFRTSVYCCKFNPRDKILACGCFSGSIILYRFSTSLMRLKHVWHSFHG